MKKLIIFSLVFFFVGCTKSGKNITLKGKVLNPVTGEGIAGAEIWLQKTAGGYNGGWKTVKKAVSNGDGNFVLEKIGFAGYAAVAGAFQGEYFELGWTQDQGVTYTGNFKIWTKIGKTMHADYYAVPYGDYQIKIKNVNCMGANDTIIINRSDDIGFTKDYDWVLSGCADYTTSSSKVPMGKLYTKYTVIRSGVSTVFETVFTVVPNQMNYQEILY